MSGPFLRGAQGDRVRANLALLGALVLLLAGLLLGLRSEIAHRRQVERSAEVQAQTLADSLTAAIAFDDVASAREYLSALRANPSVQQVRVFNAGGGLFAEYRRGDSPLVPRPEGPFPARFEDGAVAVATPVQEGDQGLGLLVLQTTAERPDALIVRHGALALLLTMALTMVGLVSRASRQLERRAEALRQANAELDAANYRLQQEIAERERVEGALRQSQKMEALGHLTGGIAHDFNNLLQVIQGSLDLILRRAQEPRLERWAKAALEAAERGAELTRQLLAFSRTQKMRIEPVQVAEMVQGMTELLARTVGGEVEVRMELGSEEAHALSDRTQLELALLNLVVNARDAMTEGGEITVSTEVVSVPEGDALLEPGDYVALRVRDSGMGMPSDVADRAFDPFFTTKPVGKGTGLGLSQVYGVAKQAGGAAQIESVPGVGTTVTMFLRRSQTHGLPAEQLHLHPSVLAPVVGASILVVDDDHAVRALVSESLLMLGYEVRAVSSGAEGLAALQAENADLAIVDFAMPLMNGAEFARQARKLHPKLPLIFASGHANTDAIEAAAGSDASVLRKPFHMQELAQAVAAILQDGGAGDSEPSTNRAKDVAANP